MGITIVRKGCWSDEERGLVEEGRKGGGGQGRELHVGRGNFIQLTYRFYPPLNLRPTLF